MSKKEIEEKDLEKLMKKWMGKEFKKQPLPTKEEFEDIIMRKRNAYERLLGMNGPQYVINSYLEDLSVLLKEYTDGKYAVTKEELDYNRDYYAREESFWDHHTLGCPICKYLGVKHEEGMEHDVQVVDQ